MKGFRINTIRLNLYEDDHHGSAQVTIEWSHDVLSAAQVLKMCGGIELPSSAMLSESSIDKKALRTVRTFRFESRTDALDAYAKFEELLRDQGADVSTINGP